MSLLPKGLPAPGNALDAGEELTPDDVHSVAVEGAPLVIGRAGAARMAASSDLLARMAGQRRRVYGVTTGFGPLARHFIPPQSAEGLQRNLLNHLSCGVGAPLPRSYVRAIMAVRAANLARGHSGIGSEVFDLLLACLNRGVIPVVPEMGTVSASGDLTPLAHVALVLIGEGEAWVGEERLPGSEALVRAGLAPVSLGRKDALALVNGTSAAAGIAALNNERAKRLWGLGLRLGLLYAEILEGFSDAFDRRLGAVRPHPGQLLAHRLLEQWSRDGKRLRTLESSVPSGESFPEEAPQDPYSIRCLPQVFGAVWDVVLFHERILTTEISAVTDNPVLFPEQGDVLHGGNFHGQHLAFASDALDLGVVEVALHAERAVARLCNPSCNRGLPPFLHSGAPGLNSGLMGAQVTASALVAELRMRAHPASIQSIPTNNDNQDVVPMAMIAARKTAAALDLAFGVLAILALAVSEAARVKGPLESYCGSSRSLLEVIRQGVPPLEGDRSLSRELAALAADLEKPRWLPDPVKPED